MGDFAMNILCLHEFVYKLQILIVFWDKEAVKIVEILTINR